MELNLNRLSQILSSRDPYKKVSDEERKRIQTAENEVKKDVIAFSEVAYELFQDKRYIKLANRFTDIVKSTIRLIIYYEETDIYKYNAKMREYQIQLRTLMNIFDTPQGFIDKAEQILKGKK